MALGKRNELKKLTRLELLELLYEQSKEIDTLRAELEKAHADAENRQIAVEASGSIAEAALRLNGVFEAAQAAADQYLENIKRMGDRHET